MYSRPRRKAVIQKPSWGGYMIMRAARIMMLFLGLVMASASVTVAEELVTQEDVDRKPGRYTVSVKGIGEFGIDKIVARTQKKCSVHVGSLGKAISAKYARGTTDFEVGEKTNIMLALSECIDNKGDTVMCCKGRGSLCNVSVTAIRLF